MRVATGANLVVELGVRTLNEDVGLAHAYRASQRLLKDRIEKLARVQLYMDTPKTEE